MITLSRTPVVICGAIEHWTIRTKWNFNYFKDKVGSLKIPVALSPSGIYGDIPEIAPGNSFVLQRFDTFIDYLTSCE